MRIERALKLRDSLRTTIADIYSAAVHHAPTAEELTASVIKAKAQAGLKAAPQWVASYLDGYAHALNDRLYREHLIFGGFVNGVFYSTHRDRPDYYEHNGIEPSAYADDGIVRERGHYWKPTEWRKEVKRFY